MGEAGKTGDGAAGQGLSGIAISNDKWRTALCAETLGCAAFGPGNLDNAKRVHERQKIAGFGASIGRERLDLMPANMRDRFSEYLDQ